MSDPIEVYQQAPVSGLYVHREQFSSTWGIYVEVTDNVRLDVDGTYPLMRASGLHYPHGPHSIVPAVHWISDELTEISNGVWQGDIFRRFPEPSFPQPSSLPHSTVRLKVVGRSYITAGRRMILTFTGGAPDVSKTFEFDSPYFRTAEFEFDSVETAPRVTAIDTWAHPVHADVRPRTRTIADVYSYAGIDLQQSPNTNVIGLEVGGVGHEHDAEIWDDQQLHDAMRVFWSRYQPHTQWAGWLLFAHRHRDPLNNGIMFDHGAVKPNDGIHRQGAAVFGDAVADHVPSDETHPALWLPRRRFFSAIHEIGHCFNLGHSWEKGNAQPWVSSLGPVDQALSIMNYPERVGNFWKQFEYRFDPKELYFLRHAPREFVEMGDAAWGENHGDRFSFQQNGVNPNHPFMLELVVDRSRAVFEFLEPALLEVVLTNTSGRPQLVDSTVLDDLHSLTIVIAPRTGSARQWRPYARRCMFPALRLLQHGECLRASLFVSAGLDGWYLAEPGAYSIQARLDTPEGSVVAEPLAVRIASPRSWDEEYLAQDSFMDEVGRAYAFGGTQVMSGALSVLENVTERLAGRAVARHATLALALPLMRNSKLLRLPVGRVPMSSVAADRGKFEVVQARPEEARRMLHKALLTDQTTAVATFGSLIHRRHMEWYAAWLHDTGDAAAGDEISAALSLTTDGRPYKEGSKTIGKH